MSEQQQRTPSPTPPSSSSDEALGGPSPVESELVPPGSGNMAATEALRARHPDDPATYDAALNRNARAHAVFEAFIERHASRAADPSDPESRENLLRNSAQWIAEGEATVSVLTPVHDSHEREGLGEREVAWFDPDSRWDDAQGTYRPWAETGNNDGLETAPRSTYGTMEGAGHLLEVYGVEDEKKIEESLVHEVQHDADGHGCNEEEHFHQGHEDKPTDNTNVFVAPDWVYRSFDTEFRGWWLNDLPELAPEMVVPENFTVRAAFEGEERDNATGFHNARQESIFVVLMGGSRNKAKTDWLDPVEMDFTTAYGWAPHFYAMDDAFKRHVDGKTAFESANGVNSVRIQALSEAIETGDVDAVLAAAEKLDDVDRGWLKDRRSAAAFWEHAREHVPAGDPMEALEQLVDVSAPTRELAGLIVSAGESGAVDGAARRPRTVVVERNESLSEIAARELGDGGRWREIYELNREAIGSDPHSVRRGLELVLPGDA